MAVFTIIVFSCLGFAGFLALDIPALHKKRAVQAGVALASVLSLITAFVIATQEGEPIGVPVAGRWIGIPMMIAGAGLMIYSTLIEIPLAFMHSPTLNIDDVYKNGTYALCRHPGFLWMLVYLIGLVIVYNLTSTIMLGILWMVLEMLVVVIQDRVIFPRRFPSYDAYRRTTPFIIPTLSSLMSLFQFKAEVNQ